MTAKYGILKSVTNTGRDDELLAVFASPISIVSNEQVIKGDTLSLKRRAADLGVQRWEIESECSQLEEAHEFTVHAMKYGTHTPFPIRMPQLYKKRATGAPGHLLTKTGAAVQADTVAVYSDDPIAAMTYGLRPGEFISFNGQQKVYMVMASRYDSANNVLNLTVKPRIRQAVAAGTLLFYGARVTMMAYYDIDNATGIKYTDGVLAAPGTLKFVEA